MSHNAVPLVNFPVKSSWTWTLYEQALSYCTLSNKHNLSSSRVYQVQTNAAFENITKFDFTCVCKLEVAPEVDGNRKCWCWAWVDYPQIVLWTNHSETQTNTIMCNLAHGVGPIRKLLMTSGLVMASSLTNGNRMALLLDATQLRGLLIVLWFKE